MVVTVLAGTVGDAGDGLLRWAGSCGGGGRAGVRPRLGGALLEFGQCPAGGQVVGDVRAGLVKRGADDVDGAARSTEFGCNPRGVVVAGLVAVGDDRNVRAGEGFGVFGLPFALGAVRRGGGDLSVRKVPSQVVGVLSALTEPHPVASGDRSQDLGEPVELDGWLVAVLARGADAPGRAAGAVHRVRGVERDLAAVAVTLALLADPPLGRAGAAVLPLELFASLVGAGPGRVAAGQAVALGAVCLGEQAHRARGR